MNMIVGFEIVHMALWIRDLDLLSHRNTSLSILNDSWNFKFFTSVYCISCWRGIFANVVTLFKGDSFFNCFHKGLSGFSWKTVTAGSWTIAFSDNEFLSGWSELSKDTTAKLNEGKWLKRATFLVHISHFLGQTQLHN